MPGTRNLGAMLKRQNQMAMEAAWTKEEAIAWARARHERIGRWPSCRWRVEVPGKPGLSSRLLTKARASQIACEVAGATAVELIPTATAAGIVRGTKHNLAAADMPDCPKCKQPKGQGCRTPANEPCKPHRRRVLLAAATCDECGHVHAGPKLAAICIGCPCPRRPLHGRTPAPMDLRLIEKAAKQRAKHDPQCDVFDVDPAIGTATKPCNCAPKKRRAALTLVKDVP